MMKRLKTVVLLTLVLLPAQAFSSLESGAEALLKIRASEHSDFLRIVLEGPEELIAQGKVDREQTNIAVKFIDNGFSIQNGRMKVPFTREDNRIIFALNDIGDMKVFSLDDPSRIVIDVYQKEKGKKSDEAVPAARIRENAPATEVKRTENVPKEKQKDRPADVRTGSSAPVTVTGTAKSEPVAATNEAGPADDEIDLVPDAWRKIWMTLKKENNPFRVLNELHKNRPSDAASLAVYHFVYGEALRAAKKHFEAIEQLRLAYIYSSDNRLKEAALFRRAEVYRKIGFSYEAAVNYQVFLKDHPSSGYAQRAHLGLANCMSETGNFAEAITHYEQSGKSPEVLFNMANALQKLDRVDEARKAYENAMISDRNYPESSPETYYLRAENMRMTGRTEEAKQIFAKITTGPYRDHANISLGLIAMEELQNKDAIQYFQTVEFTRDIKVRVKALFYISLVYLKEGKLKDSIQALEQVRKNYPDSAMYNDALLLLSKLYRQEGRVRESVSLLKELVYGIHPPAEAFSELETLLLETKDGAAAEGASAVTFADLWRETGQWMLDASRADFLMKVAERLRPDEKSFLQICSWVAENAKGQARKSAAFEMASYFAGLRNIEMTERYVNIIRETGRELKMRTADDSLLRVEARLSSLNRDHEQALKNIQSVKDFSPDDLKLLGEIASAYKQSGGNIRNAVAFYEKMINRLGGDAEDHIRLADILYDENEEKALSYYRTAYEKDPQNEWAAYRIALIVDMPETGDMFTKLQNGNSLVGRIARTKLLEIKLIGRIDEVYQ